MSEPTLARVKDQLDYYDKTAKRSQTSFRVVKVCQLLAAASIPVAAAADASTVVMASIGALILILEGIQALFAWQQNWMNYRKTAEALHGEQHLFQASAGPYSRTPNPQRLFAERVEALLSSERSVWVATQIPPGSSQSAPNGVATVTPEGVTTG
jgi:hypothetical protein